MTEGLCCSETPKPFTSFTSFPFQRDLLFHNFTTLGDLLGTFTRSLLLLISYNLNHSTGYPTQVLGSTLKVYVEELSIGIGFFPGEKSEAAGARSIVSLASTWALHSLIIPPFLKLGFCAPLPQLPHSGILLFIIYVQL